MDANWNSYVSGVDKATLPTSTNPAPVVKYAVSDNKTHTGFLHLVPQHSEVQDKYDAMSKNWQKVEPSDPNIYKAIFGAPLK